ncbi:hypothetical protein CYMTET_9610, partial [Cymbomonas tetramitiformis]
SWASEDDLLLYSSIASNGRGLLKLLGEDEARPQREALEKLIQELEARDATQEEKGHWALLNNAATGRSRQTLCQWLLLEGFLVRARLHRLSSDGPSKGAALEATLHANGVGFEVASCGTLSDEQRRSRKKEKKRRRGKDGKDGKAGKKSSKRHKQRKETVRKKTKRRKDKSRSSDSESDPLDNLSKMSDGSSTDDGDTPQSSGAGRHSAGIKLSIDGFSTIWHGHTEICSHLIEYAVMQWLRQAKMI